VELRPATPADGAALAGIYAPYVLGTPITFEEKPPDAAEMGRRVAATLPRHPYLVAVDRGSVIGYAYGGTHRTRAAYRWSVEVSVYVDASAHRSGAGRALYAALFRLLAAQGYPRAFAGITLPNPASTGFHEAMGFMPIGVFRRIGWKQGAWHDVGWWQLDLDAPDDPPQEPQPLDALDPAVIAAALRG
jgi:L-amino acid N-acyltransferase YncA